MAPVAGLTSAGDPHRRVPAGDDEVGPARSGVTVGLQVFNLFNRTNYDLPEHFADEPTTFGRIFSAKAPRQIQLTARLGF